MKDKKIELLTVKITLCSLCLNGEGGICNVPGCALMRNTAPDIGVDENLYEVIRREKVENES